MRFNEIEKEYLKVSREFTLPARSGIELFSHPRKKAGIRINRARLRELYIVVPVIVQSDEISIDDIKVDVNSWLSHNESKKLSFNFYPEYYYMAKLSAIKWNDETETVMKGLIEFICEDPFRFGQTQSLSLSTSNQTFTIGGQESTPWASKTRFTVPQSVFTLESSLGKIILNYNFIAGDILEIDYDKRDVRLNGNDLAVSIDLRTVWFELKPGQVQLKASHATELSYNERYY